MENKENKEISERHGRGRFERGGRKETEKQGKKVNKNRIRMESRTHGIMLVTTEKDGRKSWASNKAKYGHKDAVMGKELRWILHAEEDERFVKGCFCFRFIESTKPNPRATANKVMEIQKVQQKLHRELQIEFKWKIRTTKITGEISTTETRPRTTTKTETKTKRITIQSTTRSSSNGSRKLGEEKD